jgi:hypothetical protein
MSVGRGVSMERGAKLSLCSPLLFRQAKTPVIHLFYSSVNNRADRPAAGFLRRKLSNI